ncbi:hypothetical protein QVD17_42023 [Tagetes erecta]|uniref:CCHC-type domain-containing protein n=1 Tax=Tagetes erecta TaxID=13708 RepID=A0AAD8JRM2_TARER|nr:hypothetical protein QVD17_42023 [Tagetes erecta]
MSNISKLEFSTLNISGENYMSWTANVKRHLKSMNVLETIEEDNESSEQDNAKADVFLHKHIDELLQHEYFNCDNPSMLWEDLKSRFGHLREVLLPNARDEWDTLRFQDFKRVNDYTSALYQICSKLEFCGHPKSEEEKLEKTYSTFHASNINLQTHYRLQNFRRYSDLNALLLVAEKNNDLLMKNHQSRPTGSLAIPEANVAHNNYSGRKWEHGHGRGRGRGRGHFDKKHFNGRKHSFKLNTTSYGRGRGRGHSQRANEYHVPRNNNSNQQAKFKNEASTSQNHGSQCFKCGSSNHWSKACRTPPHLCKLYQASLKENEKEANHVDTFDNANTE